MNRIFRRKMISTALGVYLSLLAACSTPLAKVIIREEPSQIPSLIDVPADGRYGLFPAGESEAILQFDLNKSEKIGFELSQAPVLSDMQLEQVFAIAGEHRLLLDITKAYEWRKE